MPVERIDAQIQSLISGANLETQQKIGKEDEADHAAKVAAKKIEQKREELKGSTVQRETFHRQNELQGKMRQILGGQAGQDAANALNSWQNNQQLQAKLTETQKNMFREAMAKNPQKTTETANGLARLTQTPGFQKAITNSQQAGTLQAALIDNPKLEHPASEILQNRFMQSPKADAQTKNQFMRFGLQHAAKNQMDAVRQAGDMLGTLAKSTPRNAQRAAMNMVQRQPGDQKATSNVDRFLQDPNVGKMPSFARGKATELLCKANGKSEVKEGFEQLAGNAKFKAQTAQNKGRFFATIGTGRPSEYRAITDHALQALQSSNFPNRAGQVGKFLNKMAAQVRKGGGIDTQEAMKSAKLSSLPSPPTLSSAEGLDPDEATKVRAQNRGKLMQFFNQLQRAYEQGEKKLSSAKYLEDVNALQNLRDAEEIDTSALSSEEQAFVKERSNALKAKLGKVRDIQRQRSRELRGKRMPPAKRRAMQAARRAQGRQPKYFNPNTGRVPASEVFAQQAVGGSRQGLPANPARGPIGRSEIASGGNVQAQVAQAISSLGSGPITPERAGQVAKVIAQQVAQQVVQQVTQQLLGQTAPQVQAPQPMANEGSVSKTTGKTDGWGIPRSFERDLGGAQRNAVKPATSRPEGDAPSYDDLAAEKYTGRMLVKDASGIRALDELFQQSWKGLSKPEAALLKNLGWSQQTWDTKDTPAARWPAAMATPFASLSVLQREAVRKLGFTPHDWDTKVQAFTMGKNA